MAIEEIDPTTGEVTGGDDELATLRARLAQLTGGGAAATTQSATPTTPVRTESENPDPNAQRVAVKETAAPATVTKLSERAAAPARATPAKKTQTAVASASGGAVAVAGGTDMDALMAQYAGRGLNFDTRDLAIPRLVLLQDNSPQVKKGTLDYVPGAEAGMLMNSVDNSLMNDVLLVPIHYKRRFVGWKPRDEKGGGGGLVRPDVPEAEYLQYEEIGIGRRAYHHDDKIGIVEVIDTPEWYVLLSTDGATWAPAAIAMPGTKAKTAGKMNTMIVQQVHKLPDGREVTPACFFNIFLLGSKREGEGSQAYFTFVATYHARVGDPNVIARAAGLQAQFAAGELDAAPMMQD